MLILVVNSSYSQYPIIKKIKDDSVVLITLQQANTINTTYLAYKDSVRVIKDSIVRQQFVLDSLNRQILPLIKQHEEYKWKYLANRETYFQRETEFNKLRKIDEFAKFILAGIILLQFSQLH